MYKPTKLFILLFITVLINCSNILGPSKTDKTPDIILVDSIQDLGFEDIIKDPFTINTTFVKKNKIYLDVNYQGERNSHNFKLYSSAPVIETNPPGCDLFLVYDSENDSCITEITQRLKFDLSPLKKYDEEQILIYLQNYHSDYLQFVGGYKP